MSGISGTSKTVFFYIHLTKKKNNDFLFQIQPTSKKIMNSSMSNIKHQSSMTDIMWHARRMYCFWMNRFLLYKCKIYFISVKEKILSKIKKIYIHIIRVSKASWTYNNNNFHIHTFFKPGHFLYTHVGWYLFKCYIWLRVMWPFYVFAYFFWQIYIHLFCRIFFWKMRENVLCHIFRSSIHVCLTRFYFV